MHLFYSGLLHGCVEIYKILIFLCVIENFFHEWVLQTLVKYFPTPIEKFITNVWPCLTQYNTSQFYINFFFAAVIFSLVMKIHLTCFRSKACLVFIYNKIPPYGHLGDTVTSLLPPFFWLPGKTAIHFLVKKKTLVNTVTR